MEKCGVKVCVVLRVGAGFRDHRERGLLASHATTASLALLADGHQKRSLILLNRQQRQGDQEMLFDTPSQSNDLCTAELGQWLPQHRERRTLDEEYKSRLTSKTGVILISVSSGPSTTPSTRLGVAQGHFDSFFAPRSETLSEKRARMVVYSCPFRVEMAPRDRLELPTKWLTATRSTD